MAHIKMTVTDQVATKPAALREQTTSLGPHSMKPAPETFCREEECQETQETVPPIAIVGMAMRLPGSVNSADEFWRFLIDKQDGLCEVPGTRYKLDSFYDAETPHAVKTRRGYFLSEDPMAFDAAFFSIPAQEAARMDPQQRHLLEVTYECLESAGETNWRGKDVGCFVGVFGEDWLELAAKDPQQVDRYHVLGTGQFALANRISYEYDFCGPSLTVQTGCSSSMVGLHAACQALYAGDCSAALVAGTNLILSPTMTTTMSDNTVLAPDGICKTFDANADGYGRGEAVNAIYIKRLEDALSDQDPIRAVIRATGSNADGRTPSITTPGSVSQEALIRQTYQKAGIHDISQTAFFECHGTGTTVGDTAEISVIAKLLGSKGAIIGAVKPNVGHSEGASGITSMIKAVCSLEHRVIPPNIYFNSPNPNIPFEEARLQVPTEAMAWPGDRCKRISVNCFGIGGSNAHAIVEAAPAIRATSCPQGHQPSLLVLSAKTADALHTRKQQIVRWAQQHPDQSHDLAYTLGLRREHLQHRAFLVSQPGATITDAGFQSGRARPHDLIFVFNGQGAQWAGMGRDLMAQFPEFRASIQDMDKVLQSLPDAPEWTLQDEMSQTADAGRVNEAAHSQPLCTALQIGIVAILERWGVRSSSVVGHSSGEIAAAYAAGAISLRCAIILAYYRGKSVTSQKGKGGMLAVGMGLKEVSPYLVGDVVVACENSPQNVTLSGEQRAIDETLLRIQESCPGVFCKSLPVDIAYHSGHMADVGPIYEQSIEPYMEYGREAMLPLISTVTSDVVSNPHELSAAYWRRNLESRVQFSTAIRITLSRGRPDQVFLEVGPHAALAGSLRQLFNTFARVPKSSHLVHIPTIMRETVHSRAQLLTAVGYAHIHGACEVNFREANGEGNTLSNLPRYPWDHRETYCHESRLSRDWRFRSMPHHELLGTRVLESSDLVPMWRNVLRLDDVSWICDHVLQGKIVFPGAAYIAMAGAAVRQLHPQAGDYEVKNIIFKSPLILETKDVEIMTTLRPVKYTDLVESEWYEFSMVVHDGAGWMTQCHGQVRPGCDYPPQSLEVNREARVVDSAKWYRALARVGLEYGPHFRGLTDISVDPIVPRASATVRGDEVPRPSRYTLHPTVIDQCFQLMSVAGVNGLDRRNHSLAIPMMIERIYVGGSASQMSACVNVVNHGSRNPHGAGGLMSRGEVLLSFQKATAFKLQNDNDVPPVPVAAGMQFTPDADLLLPSALLGPAPALNEKDQFMRDIGQLSWLYILEAADQLRGITPTIPHYCLYKNWLDEQCASVRHGQFSHWANLGSARRWAIIQELEDPWKDHPLFSAALVCARQVIDHCTELAMGVRSALETLMTDGLLERYYSIAFQGDTWKRVLSLLGHFRPGMQVLEIGAGTGTGTMEALRQLQSTAGVRLYSKYVFTDVSAGFMAAAQEKFRDFESIDYKVLDISSSPIEQGFEPGSFDLVIASNVLHATPSLHETLKNVRQLLAPGGRLLLNEMHPDVLITNFIMGILPGWWVGIDDGRTNQPFVSPGRWDLELRAAGLTGSEAFVWDAGPPLQHNFNMLSRPVRPPSPKREVFLLCTRSPGAWVDQVASEFRDKEHVVHWGNLESPPPSTCDIICLLEVDDPFLHDLSEQSHESLQNYLTQLGENPILWVTHETQMACADPRFGMVLGLARSLRQESGLAISTFETDVFNAQTSRSLYQVYEKIQSSREWKERSLDDEFLLHDGIVYVPRCHWGRSTDIRDDPSRKDVPRCLDLGSDGLLDTLRWVDVNERPMEDSEVEIDMRYTGLNFRDIMVAMGIIGTTRELGLEGSGIVRRVGAKVAHIVSGDRVAVTNTGLFRTRAVVDQDHCVVVPSDCSLQDAAASMTAFVTAIHSLIHVGALRRGKTVLIHSACGAVGLASVRIAQRVGATVFATVGNDEKRQFLVDHLGISPDAIFCSRDTSFYTDVMRQTDGRGVDIVLNSLAGRLLHASWDCVASRGKMIELGKRDLLANGTLSMTPFVQNRSFVGVDLLSLAAEDPGYIKDLSRQVIDFWSKDRQPIRPITTFPAVQVQDAFSYMQKGTHMGKILIEMPPRPSDLGPSARKTEPAFSGDVSYVLTGGLGGIGRAISTWMVENGARHLVYLSRSAGRNLHDQAFLEELRIQGCEPVCVPGDIRELDDVKRAVASCRRPVAGVLHLSMVLKDCAYKDMTYQDWLSCVGPKVRGAWNLHHALAGEQLDFFVLFGSTGGVCGNHGQTNYAAANTFLDGFAQYRHDLGLPCSMLDLGPVEDVGVFSQDPSLLQTLRSASVRSLREKEVMEGIWTSICNSPATQAPRNHRLILGLGCTKPLSDPTVRAPWGMDARFEIYANLACAADRGCTTSNDRFRALLNDVRENPAVLDDPDTLALIRQELGKMITRHMPQAQDMNDDEIAAVAVDSLMAIEVRSWLRRNLGLEVTMAELSRAKTVGALAAMTTEHLKVKYAQARSARAPQDAEDQARSESA